MIEAKVICDSVSPAGKRLTTFKLRYPKFIHGEFMTHRVISRNASSSRAIPTAKLLQEVREDALRAAPIFWGKNQPGMQAVKELSIIEQVHSVHPDGYSFWKPEIEMAQFWWEEAARHAANCAEQMLKIGVHKQIVNRILEPFSHINVVASATEWDNFFGLRLHKDAQPEMRELAERMWHARQESEPELLQPGEWHLPFIERADLQACAHAAGSGPIGQMQLALKVSTSRCARVSFENFETGKRSTVEDDIKLYDEKLFRPGQAVHASPAEHQATPDEAESYDIYMPTELTEEQKARREMPVSMALKMKHPEQWGNLVGWRQHRKMLAGEACAPLPAGY